MNSKKFNSRRAFSFYFSFLILLFFFTILAQQRQCLQAAGYVAFCNLKIQIINDMSTICKENDADVNRIVSPCALPACLIIFIQLLCVLTASRGRSFLHAHVSHKHRGQRCCASKDHVAITSLTSKP